MATRADISRYTATTDAVRKLARRDLERFVDALGLSDALSVRSALEDFLPALVDRYGEVSATVAADWYEELRAKAGAPGSYRASLAPLPDPEAVRRGVRWSVAPVFSETPDRAAMVGRLGQVADRFVMQPGRDTIGLSVERDPSQVRYARVPSSADPCAFCVMLASRGAVYRSRATAGGEDPSRYHADCGCVATPMWPQSQYPEGYDPDALYSQYEQAVQALGGERFATEEILAKMRELHGFA